MVTKNLRPQRIVEEPILIENARIIYLNFKGEKRLYNNDGERNFHVIIEDEGYAQALLRDGWNLKTFKPRDDEEVLPGYHMEVTVGFKNPKKMPTIVMVTQLRNGEEKGTVLTEDTVGLLDSAEIIRCDLEIRPSNWSNDNGSGVKAYLKTLYATIKPNPFAEKYSHLRFNAASTDVDITEE